MTDTQPYNYPPTRWQVMAETGETVDETFDAYQAFANMVYLMSVEWQRLDGWPRESHYSHDKQITHANAARGVVRVADRAVEDAVNTIVKMVDAYRHASKVVNLDGAARDRALELLVVHDSTDMEYRDWSVFRRNSGTAPLLRVMLAADPTARRTVTDLMIAADKAVMTALIAVETELRAMARGNFARETWEPERDKAAREAKEAAERAELEALGINLGGRAR